MPAPPAFAAALVGGRGVHAEHRTGCLWRRRGAATHEHRDPPSIAARRKIRYAMVLVTHVPALTRRRGAQALVIDDEVAWCREERREFGIALLELPGPRWAVADAGVPGLQELLTRMRPLPRHQDLELHRVEALLASPALGEPDEFTTDTLAAVSRVGDQHSELALACI